MWDAHAIEIATHERLRRDLGNVRGDELFAVYLLSRKNLVEDILQQIVAVLPDHTDHGPDHVRDVMRIAWRLLGENAIDADVTGCELFGLLLSILFHDTGNIYGREGHQRRISNVMQHALPSVAEINRLRVIVTTITEAHCGKARDGSRDTLRLVDETTTLSNEKVHLRHLAAILRFSDELAEGPQRTSRFMQKELGYKPNSSLYHEYANVVQLRVDRGGHRIAVTCDIPVKISRGQTLSQSERTRLRRLLRFAYQRFVKLNQERQYARYYCSLLEPFRETQIVLNFFLGGETLYKLDADPIILDDLVVPGADDAKGVVEIAPQYDPDRVLSAIREAIGAEV